MTLETCEADDEVGTRVTVDGGGRISGVDDFPRQQGTTVEVRNLFFNAPARSKFLKSVSAESRAVSEAVTSLALANPQVAFTLTSDDRTLLELTSVKDAAARIAQVWPGEEAAALIAASGEDSGLVVRGLIQRPDAAQPGLRRAQLFVNGRPFRAPSLIRAADRGYKTTIPHGARPWVFLYLRVPDGDVDVNVHPAKAEVRFREGGRVEAVVEEAVRSALEGEHSSASFDTQLSPPAMVREKPDPREEARASTDQMALFATRTISEVTGAQAESVDLPESVGGRPRLWQVLNTYILAETRDGIIIVDQHSAHERVLFERLMTAFGSGGQDGQRLLFPLTIRLTPAEYAQVQDLSGLLARAGFEAEGFGGDTVIVHAVPNPHPYFDAERAFREMIAELTNGSELVRSARNQHERIAMTFACKGAIKAGQKLNDREMQELFDQLFATQLPHHDVHGRPTIVRLPSSELERKFGRH
jgi:DNA mismatch repair protein MutL